MRKAFEYSIRIYDYKDELEAKKHREKLRDSGWFAMEEWYNNGSDGLNFTVQYRKEKFN